MAQCLEHVITTHALYFPLLRDLAAGAHRPTWWERASPLSGVFGRLLIRTLRPENTRKSKTSARALPSASDIGGDIVARFAAHQAEMAEHLRRLPDGLDPASTIITSPLLGFVTYSLDDTFTIFVVHGDRHLLQARRVTEAPGFPG